MFFTSKAFWTATAERAAKSFGQGALVAVGGNVVSAWELDYLGVAGTAAGMALVSILTSVASANVGDAGPSLGGETLTEKVAAVEAPAQAPTEYVAGPAAQVPEGEPVHVVRDIDSVKGAVTREVNDALRQPADPLAGGNGDEDYR